jgi:hypothetical protein
VFSDLLNSAGRAREPSHPDRGKQSWKTARIAARAMSLHPAKTPESSFEICVHTAGQEPSDEEDVEGVEAPAAELEAGAAMAVPEAGAALAVPEAGAALAVLAMPLGAEELPFGGTDEPGLKRSSARGRLSAAAEAARKMIESFMIKVCR